MRSPSKEACETIFIETMGIVPIAASAISAGRFFADLSLLNRTSWSAHNWTDVEVARQACAATDIDKQGARRYWIWWIVWLAIYAFHCIFTPLVHQCVFQKVFPSKRIYRKWENFGSRNRRQEHCWHFKFSFLKNVMPSLIFQKNSAIRWMSYLFRASQRNITMKIVDNSRTLGSLWWNHLAMKLPKSSNN